MSGVSRLFLNSSIVTLLLFSPAGADRATFAQDSITARTPSDVVREFYRAMSEKRFREAFALTVYRPAIEPLSAKEFEELRPEFEKIAALTPEKIEVTGEQISGETATVFVKMTEDGAEQTKPHTMLRRAGGAWVFGDVENETAVKKLGKNFFFEARINAHHDEVMAMLTRIATAELVYSAQHDGRFAELVTLVAANLVPKDLLTVDSTGYRFRVTTHKDGKSYTSTAEPAKYGRTGRLSFLMD
ncbi:MAG: hypothetical protein ACR2LZ_12760, partial [Pyrinomonadaceae bacterium]